jgi:anti-sigma-K factor RskA
MSGDNNDRLERLPGAIRDAIPPIAPPPSLEARVLDAVAREIEQPAPEARRGFESLRRGRLAPAFAGAAVVVAAASVAVSLFGGGGRQGVLEIETVLRAPDGPVTASLEVRKTGIGRVVTFSSDTLPILPKGDYYELWFVGPGDRPERPNRISAGTFHPDEDGRSSVRFAAAVDPTLYPVLVVTAEPGDGDPRPTGPEVLRGEP